MCDIFVAKRKPIWYIYNRKTKVVYPLELNEKIKMLRAKHNMTLEEVGNIVGVGKSTVRKWESGDIANMRRDKIAKLAEALHTTPAYLMGWDDDPSASLPSNVLPLPNMRKVPLLGTIACGTPILAAENLDGYVKMPENVHADFCLRCKGDSMIGARIMDGDLVFIHQQPDVDNGAIAAVIVEDEATLKRIYKSTGKIILQPENPRYEPFVFVGEELSQIRIIGKAVAFLSGVE